MRKPTMSAHFIRTKMVRVTLSRTPVSNFKNRMLPMSRSVPIKGLLRSPSRERDKGVTYHRPTGGNAIKARFSRRVHRDECPVRTAPGKVRKTGEGDSARLAARNIILMAALFLSAVLANSATFETAQAGYAWRFPRDHGAHPAYKTEWWYYTANLKDAEGHEYGVQLTFFREALKTAKETASSFEPVNLYFAHFAVSDNTGKVFLVEEKAGRPGPGQAGAAEGLLKVWNGGWSATYEPLGHHLRAQGREMSVDLKVSSAIAPVLNGVKGYSDKGDGYASMYYSLPHLWAEGTLTWKGKELKVSGPAWMDHEFFTGGLPEGARGWDWMGLHLSDGSQLMLFRLRGEGPALLSTSGTYALFNGKAQVLSNRDFKMVPEETWKSPRSKAEYPVVWHVTVGSLDLSFDVQAPFGDHELDTSHSTHVTYWDGPVALRGKNHGRAITGKGYLEMTGYDGRFGGF